MRRALPVLALLCGLLPVPGHSQEAPAPEIPAPEPAPLAAVPPAPPAALRRFQPDDFALAYDVFVGTGQLEPALRVAQQAVRELPRDRAWRRKLAQVAEWLARTDIAAEQWHALFALGDRSETTLQSLLRLAPSLDDPTAVLPVWIYRAQQGALSDAQWHEIYWLFENASEPRRGSEFFEAQFRQRRHPLLLERAALLARHAGDERRALALYRERLQLEPFSGEALQEAVFILVRGDRLEEALALMKSQAERIPPAEAEFWRLFAQVAWEARDYETAARAYLPGKEARSAEVGDWWRLIFLTRPQQPRRAAELALEAWRRHDSLEMLLLGLEILTEVDDPRAQARVYESLEPQQRTRAEANLGFLLGRAQFWQRQHQRQAAWADLQRARRLAPGDETAILTTLWFLIDAGWQAELTQSLAQHEKRARSTPSFWPPYAAGRQLLGQAREAAGWYRLALERAPDDALLLASYAETLQQQGRTGLADRVYRQAWRQLEVLRQGRRHLTRALAQPEFMAWVRLWLRQHPGDPSLRLMRRLHDELRDLDRSGSDDAGRDDLLLAWLLTREQPESARRWVWERYLRLGRAEPLWARSQLSQMQGDRAAMARLLQDQGPSLPPLGRADLATGAGLSALALDTAWHAMQRESDADAAHERLRQQAPRQAHYVDMRWTQENLDLMQRNGVGLGARIVLTPALHLLLDASRSSQRSHDPDFSTLLPGSDRLHSAELRWLSPASETRVALLRRDELAGTNGLRLQHNGRWMPRLGYQLELRYRAPSTTSLPLRAAGTESQLGGALDYTLDRRNYLRVAPRLSRYHTQFGDALGSGHSLDLEAGHRLRASYPDWRARLVLQTQSFRRDGSLSAASLQRLPDYLRDGIASGSLDAASYFIPQSSATVAACLTTGDNLDGLSLQNDYSRAWRPFGDACLRRNSVLGNGYAATIGVAGSVLGADHLSLQWSGSDNATPGNASIRTLSIRYRHYY
ncbi:MAG: tetratricopeptide repeat protein [Curvibacter sp.]